MDIGTIIGSGIALLIMGSIIFAYFKTKDRKSSFRIKRDENTIHLFLGDDEYDEFDISDIKDDNQRIYEEPRLRT